MDSVKLLLLDVDGVLTDGKVYVTHKGERFKSFSARDNRAIAEFIANGWEVHLVTTSKWPGLTGFVDPGKVFIHSGMDKTKENILEITGGRPFIACGDDVFDLEMLNLAEIGFFPCDADHAVTCMPKLRLLHTKGGHGVVAELARTLLACK